MILMLFINGNESVDDSGQCDNSNYHSSASQKAYTQPAATFWPHSGTCTALETIQRPLQNHHFLLFHYL